MSDDFTFSVSARTVKNERLSPRARFLYVLLLAHADSRTRETFVSGECLERLLRCGRHPRQRAEGELTAAGLISKRRERDGSGKYGKTVYTVASPQAEIIPMDGSQETCADHPQDKNVPVVESKESCVKQPQAENRPLGLALTSATGRSHHSGEKPQVAASGLSKEPSKELSKHTKPRSAPLAALAESEFRAFYQKYPRHKEPQDAQRAWNSALRSGATAPEILAGLDHDLPELLAREKRFIPYPASWLRAGGWKSEPDGEQSSGHSQANDAIRREARAGQGPESQETPEHVRRRLERYADLEGDERRKIPPALMTEVEKIRRQRHVGPQQREARA